MGDLGKIRSKSSRISSVWIRLGDLCSDLPDVSHFHFRGLVTHAENDFLQLASEVGLRRVWSARDPFSISIFQKGLRIRSETSPRRYIGIGALTGILALMFYSPGGKKSSNSCQCIALHPFMGVDHHTVSSEAQRQSDSNKKSARGNRWTLKMRLRKWMP